MNELKHLLVELPGMHLIEASAGTGKTYAIALLYVRFLVELKLEPKQILVVTYTEAATKELRGRIRNRIREALDVVEGGETHDSLLRSLCQSGNENWTDKNEVCKILDRALKLFDTASIFTIHGFCLRALNENAFESGSRYDTELVTDQSRLLGEVVDDFWRKSFFNDSSQLLGYALKKKYSSDSLREFARQMVGNPKLEIIPNFSTDQVDALEADCHSSFVLVQQQWTANRPALVDLLTNDKGLSRSEDHYKERLLPELFARMDSFTAASNPYDLPTGYNKFCTSGVAKGSKPKGTPPSHSFFDQCEKLLQLVQKRLLSFQGELIAYCNGQLPIRKQQKNIRFFDDLLNDLYTALSGDNGASFASKLQTTYQAALIDEFQDTDPVQYEIFRKIYANTKLPLFLIGDPKQAIYSFRGADIFAYLQAVRDVPVEKQFTLTSNWRSTADLLAAFNLVFTNRQKPFLFEEIAYHPVTAGNLSGTELETASGTAAPLQIWLMPPEDLNVTKANTLIPEYVTAEISRLLRESNAGTALIDGKPVLPGDIAVIVRSHRQAVAIREALTPLGIPSVMRSDMTIFATDQAREICTLLQGLLNPGGESGVRAALVTDLLGRSGSDIAGFLEDESSWEECLSQFRDYHQIWQERGFMVMTRILMDRENVRGRLLRYPDGERRLTNLLHCFEVIHGKAHEDGIGMQGLVTWFSERVSAREKSEEHEIRLETDEDAVKILTIHVSKGLEYPIVFCPYLWGGIIESKDVVTFHKANNMVKDYGSSDLDLHRKQARQELLAENLRLLYVAITRAKYRCYLYGGKVTSKSDKSRPDTSPLAYLFHASSEICEGDALDVELLAEQYRKLSAADLEGQMLQLAAQSDGSIQVGQLPELAESVAWQPQQAGETNFSCRKFQGEVRSDWRVTSFTSLASHEARAVELPDRDQVLVAGEQIKPEMDETTGAKNIFTFPRGVKAGNLVHAIFEKLDFADAGVDNDQITELVDNHLGLHGFDKLWQPCISGMVKDVIKTPLPSQNGDFTLSDLKKGSWLSELDFFFPLKFISRDGLQSSLSGYLDDYQALDLKKVLTSLQFRPVQGMLKGSMDLVFEHAGRYYLLDWKSNHLGNCIEDYSQDLMKQEMVRNLYPLQYLLYSVALNRYLSLRVADYDYDNHFGGVFYLFLRGMKPQQGSQFGVFRDLPPSDLIKKLTDKLVETEGLVRYET